jgi:trk system potassium uptake protein TrkH
MMMGASAGSTAGGIKTIRILLIIKYCYYEFKRIIHPNAIVPIRYNNLPVREEVITRILAFVLIYFMLVAFGAIVLAFSGKGINGIESGKMTCLVMWDPDWVKLVQVVILLIFRHSQSGFFL